MVSGHDKVSMFQFSVPYLETEVGRNCPLRGFFPENVYWSAQLTDGMAPAPRSSTTEPPKEALLRLSGVKVAYYSWSNSVIKNAAGF